MRERSRPPQGCGGVDEFLSGRRELIDEGLDALVLRDDVLVGGCDDPYDVAIVVGAWCYLRPAELLALERGDVGDGVLKACAARRRPAPDVPSRCRYGRTRRSRRSLRGFDTRLLFPSPQGGSYDACNWRRREFNWARDAAGLPTEITPYTLRHPGISWALHAFETRYHHLLSTSAEAARAKLDVFSRLGQESATETGL